VTPTSLTDEIRAAARAVAAKAVHVRIAEDRLAPYAASLPTGSIPAPQLDPARHYLGHGDGTVAFVLALDSVNFGSGYFPRLRKRPGMSGYFTVASSLTDWFVQRGAPSAEELASLAGDECAAIFGQELADDAIRELMELFATALRDLGRYVTERFGGSFVRLVQAAEGSAERLIALLGVMPYFEDVANYGGLRVPFYKRAQLTAADLALALNGKGLGCFSDLERLTIFADNLVPHVLRTDGILVYGESLACLIESGDLIAPGSPEEIEIRACAVEAVERISELLGRCGRAATAVALDYLLWNRGQEPFYKSRPRHRTRTVFY
jgi:hypothetical protein